MPEADNFSDAPMCVLRSSHSESHRTDVSFLAESMGQVRFLSGGKWRWPPEAEHTVSYRQEWP